MFVVLCDFDVAIVEYILITAYGRSPGALLRVIRLSGFFLFSGWPGVVRFIMTLWPLHGVIKYPRSRYTTYPGFERSICVS